MGGGGGGGQPSNNTSPQFAREDVGLWPFYYSYLKWTQIVY